MTTMRVHDLQAEDHLLQGAPFHFLCRSRPAHIYLHWIEVDCRNFVGGLSTVAASFRKAAPGSLADTACSGSKYQVEWLLV